MDLIPGRGWLSFSFLFFIHFLMAFLILLSPFLAIFPCVLFRSFSQAVRDVKLLHVTNTLLARRGLVTWSPVCRSFRPLVCRFNGTDSRDFGCWIFHVSCVPCAVYVCVVYCCTNACDSWRKDGGFRTYVGGGGGGCKPSFATTMSLAPVSS